MLQRHLLSNEIHDTKNIGKYVSNVDKVLEARINNIVNYDLNNNDILRRINVCKNFDIFKSYLHINDLTPDDINDVLISINSNNQLHMLINELKDNVIVKNILKQALSSVFDKESYYNQEMINLINDIDDDKLFHYYHKLALNDFNSIFSDIKSWIRDIFTDNYDVIINSKYKDDFKKCNLPVKYLYILYNGSLRYLPYKISNSIIYNILSNDMNEYMMNKFKINLWKIFYSINISVVKLLCDNDHKLLLDSKFMINYFHNTYDPKHHIFINLSKKYNIICKMTECELIKLYSTFGNKLMIKIINNEDDKKILLFDKSMINYSHNTLIKSTSEPIHLLDNIHLLKGCVNNHHVCQYISTDDNELLWSEYCHLPPYDTLKNIYLNYRNQVDLKIKKNPNDNYARLTRAKIFVNKKKYINALHDLNYSVKYIETHGESLVLIAKILFVFNQFKLFDDVINIIRNTYGIESKHFKKCHYYCGLYLLINNDEESGLALLEKSKYMQYNAHNKLLLYVHFNNKQPLYKSINKDSKLLLQFYKKEILHIDNNLSYDELEWCKSNIIDNNILPVVTRDLCVCVKCGAFIGYDKYYDKCYYNTLTIQYYCVDCL